MRGIHRATADLFFVLSVALSSFAVTTDASARTPTGEKFTQGATAAQLSTADVVVDARGRTVHLSVPASGALRDPAMARRLDVFENGERQDLTSVTVEHAPVSIAVLMEMGGRSYELNKLLESELAYLVTPLFDRLGAQDRLALFTYAGDLQTVANFGAPPETWRAAIRNMQAPQFSESNLHDAVAQVLERMRTRPGRRAIILVTSGIDTFSSIGYDRLLMQARDLGTAIYTLTLGDLIEARLHPTVGPLARVDWQGIDERLTRLVSATGGAAYREVRALTSPAIFDDILERLRVHYRLTYAPTTPVGTSGGGPRRVEIRLAATGEHESARHRIDRKARASVLARAEYQVSSKPSSSPAEGSRQ